MKRALAERAKQSLNAAVTNAKQHETNNHRVPQQPPLVTSSSTSAIPEPSSSISNNSKLLRNEGHYESLRASPTGERRTVDGTAGISGSPSTERPFKIPRLERPPEEVVSQNNATATDAASPQSPRVIANKMILGKTATGGHNNSQPPHKRRLSLDPTLQRTASSEVAVKSNKKRIDEAEEDPNAAFYLKHQNRALATELKSLQFAVQQLEDEREARRLHCHSALQAVNELQVIWTAMEEQTVGTPSSTSFSQIMNTSGDPPSTGTGDSVEWTRALQNALVALGQPSPSMNEQHESSTDHLEQAVTNIAARAKVLQEWLGTVLKSGSISGSPKESDTTEQRLHNLQREMAIVTARCAELEAQVSALAMSRQEVVSRERRVRRNIYRMAAGMLSSEQVVKTLEQGGDDDEIEAAVQLEKQQVKSENHESDSVAVKQEDASESKQIADRVSSAQVDEFHSRISRLEESVTCAEKTIQDVRTTPCFFL
jgi:hypothetical protein